MVPVLSANSIIQALHSGWTLVHLRLQLSSGLSSVIMVLHDSAHTGFKSLHPSWGQLENFSLVLSADGVGVKFPLKSLCKLQLSALSGPGLPVLGDTARVSRRYPPIARYGVFGVLTWAKWVRYPLPSPPQKGYLSDTCVIPYDNKAKRVRCPPLRYYLERVLRDMGGISHWTAKYLLLHKETGRKTKQHTRKTMKKKTKNEENIVFPPTPSAQTF